MKHHMILRVLLFGMAAGCATATIDHGNVDSSTPPISFDPVPVPSTTPVATDPEPTHPKDNDGNALTWPTAPLMTGVQAARNRDSAVLVVPVVAGARDYRIFALPTGVNVTADAQGHEQVNGTTLFCAGYRQHNAKAAALELMRQIEVAGLSGDTRLVVEAVDTTCPFAGVMARNHTDINVDISEVTGAALGVFSLFTEAEIRARYGSMIVNGHAADPTKPGRPGPVANAAPIVLARTTVIVTPTGIAAPPTGLTFFDDFSANDQPVLVSSMATSRAQNGKYYQNENWGFLSYGTEAHDFHIDRGQLFQVVADWGQDVMASSIAYPKRPVALSDTNYLHVTYEVPSDSTQRRYWWLMMCGAAAVGNTLDAQGRVKGSLVQTPFFMADDGQNVSEDGWNCLQFFPRDGWPFPLAPDNTNPQSELRVMVNKPGNLGRDNVVNVSPMMWDSLATGQPSWFRQIDGNKNPIAKMIDDQMLIAPRTRFDVYVRRDRLVAFVNGQQKLCNDFPAAKLTMAEALLGFGQVFYHSAAERQEFKADYWDRTGQRYYLESTPFVDSRGWDNVGYGENVGLPSNFDASPCYTYKP